MRVAWIALALIFACVVWADSNPPTPTPTEKSRPIQKAAQNKGRSADEDQRGTEQRPLWVRVVGSPIVKVESAPQAQQKATENTHDEKDGPALYRGLPADAWTALFTLGLFVIGGVTAVVFICQSILLRRQILLAREEFIVSQRPRMIVRNVSATEDSGELKILYSIVNTGGSKATLIDSWVMTEFVTPGAPIRNLRAYRHQDLGEAVFTPGKYFDQWLPIENSAQEFIRTNGKTSPFPGPVELHFTGAFRYEDEFHNSMNSVFRRKFHFGSFHRTGDPEHEYAD